MRLALLLALAAPGAAITAPKQVLPPASEKLSKRGGAVKQLPITTWLPSLSKSDVLNDALAGLTVAAMLIPQGMSYAVHKSNRRGASPPRLDHDIHAIDATSARGVEHPTHWLICAQVVRVDRRVEPHCGPVLLRAHVGLCLFGRLIFRRHRPGGTSLNNASPDDRLGRVRSRQTGSSIIIDVLVRHLHLRLRIERPRRPRRTRAQRYFVCICHVLCV